MTTEQRSKEPMSALDHIEECLLDKRRLNEFFSAGVVDYQMRENVIPERMASIDATTGTITEISLRAAVRFTLFRGASDRETHITRENAYRAIKRFLYADVYRDLITILNTVGDGKRRETMEQLEALMRRIAL